MNVFFTVHLLLAHPVYTIEIFSHLKFNLVKDPTCLFVLMHIILKDLTFV